MTAPALVHRVVLGVLLSCLAGLATATQESPGPPAVPAGTAAEIDRCFALRRSEPGAAIKVADALLATPGMDVGSQIKVLSCLGIAAALAGDSGRALAAVNRVESLLAEHPMPADFSLRAVSNAGAILHIIGHTRRALDLYVRAYELARGDDAPIAQMVSLMNIGIIHSEELGAYVAADGFYRKAQAISEASGHEDASLPYNDALNLLELGRHEDALLALERTIAIAGRTNSSLLARRANVTQLTIWAIQGTIEDAEGQLATVVRAQRQLPDPGGATLGLLALSDLALARGAADTALQHADAALALAQGGGFRREQVQAMEAQLAAYQALGRNDAALAVVTGLREFEVAALRAQNIEGLADLQARLQDADGARELGHLRLRDEVRAQALSRTRLLRNWAIGGFIVLALGTLAFATYQRRVRRRLEHLSTVDPLTGLLNRRAASQRLREASAGARAADGHWGTLFLVDIDHFKDMNDRHGHTAGDVMLVEIAQRLKSGCRPGDLVARWGGEEFLVACPGLGLEQAIALAERLRTSVSARPVPLSATEHDALTVSIGFACWPFFPDAVDQGDRAHHWQESVALADSAMYCVKDNGRDGWVGLWGQAGRGVETAAVLRDPGHHIEAGDVVIVADQLPVQWPVAAMRPEPAPALDTD